MKENIFIIALLSLIGARISGLPLDKKTLFNAVKEAKAKSKKRNFKQTIEFILNLQDIDMKSPESKIHEIIELPHSPEKQNKICVIASGELALKARKENADNVLERAALEGLAGKKRELRKLASEYNIFISEAPLMPLVGKILGSFLGPKGKMPIPVPPTAAIAGLIKKHRKTVIVRMRTQPIIQCHVGTENMQEKELVENIQTVLRVLEAKLKRGVKNIKFAYIKTSMGTPIKIKP